MRSCYYYSMADIIYPGKVAGGPINAGAMPSNYDLSIYKGDAVKFTVTVKDSNGSAVDLTGYTAKASLKANYSDDSPVDFVCTISNAAGGVVSVYLSPSTSSSLSLSDYIWDFQLTEPSGDVRTYLTGDVQVTPEVTT